jgi:hypothetical protein
MTLVPEGAIGVRLKSRCPCSWAQADNLGLMCDARSRLIRLVVGVRPSASLEIWRQWGFYEKERAGARCD